MKCGFSRTTSSGTFTVYHKKLTKCEAKKFCRDKGHILAPVTTQEDKDALLDLLDDECEEHYGATVYLLGLDITPCGKTQERTFTNGVAYDKSTHGRLYEDYNTPDSKCPIAYLHMLADALIIGHEPQCISQKLRFFCLDQSTATASPIVKEGEQGVKMSISQASMVAGGVLAAFGCLALATAKIYRQKNKFESEVRVLESEVRALKSETL